MTKLRVLDLFSGLGGFSLGLGRAGGFETVAFCEIEPFCQKVLAKHWPGVPIYDDVRTLTADTLARDGIGVDVICGGFPCQDISAAGAGAGLAGERSGLWSEIARLVRELEPRYVIVENVSALLGRGMGTVLGDLAACGYDAEWQCIPASAIGAPHRRDRVWIVAYPGEVRCNARWAEQSLCGPRIPGPPYLADTSCGRRSEQDEREIQQPRRTENIGASENVANPTQQRLERGGNGDRLHSEAGSVWPGELAGSGGRNLSDPMRQGLAHGGRPKQPQSSPKAKWEVAFSESKRRCYAQWAFEPELGRVAHGIPNRVDRIAALGNAVVPQIPELIGKAIMGANA